MAIFLSPSCSIDEKRALFMHNWRCGGSSLSSLFACNFGLNFLKVGAQFDDYGQPAYGAPEKLVLGEVRNSIEVASILGGHLCSGVDALMPGDWDLWVNARHPLARLRSGILRFYSKAFAMPPGRYQLEDLDQVCRNILRNLMEGPLRHEKNGMAKRLAGFAVASELVIHPRVNLEELSCFETSCSQEDIFIAAAGNLPKINVILLPQYFHASIISLEKVYSLPPLLNLFSGLRQNASRSSGSANARAAVSRFISPILDEYCKQDVKLWSSFFKGFQRQVGSLDISRKDIFLRELLHSRPLIDLEWFSDSLSEDELIVLIAKSLSDRADGLDAGLANDLVALAAGWSRLDPLVGREIAARAIHLIKRK